MNPFEKFHIDHLSPSSLNAYIEQPSFWVAKYLFRDKFTDKVGPSAWRGTAVEAGLDKYLMTDPHKRDIRAANTAAMIRYEMDALGDLSEDVEKERRNIVPILEQAISAVCHKDRPDARQVKIEHWIDGIEVPIQGWIDYVWPDDMLDLKSTLKMPSEVPHNHARQVSIYAKAKGRPCHLLYATPKKHEIKPIVDIDIHLAYAAKQARTIRNLLWASDDREQVAKFFLPDLDHFYWKRDEAKQAAEIIWR